MDQRQMGGPGTQPPRPQMGAANQAPQPMYDPNQPQILHNTRSLRTQPRDPEPMRAAGPQFRAQPGFDPMTPQGGAIINRPSTNEVPTRPAVRPMGPFQPYDDRRDIMAGPQGMPRDARQLPNGDVVGRGDPRYFDRGPGIGINPNGRYGQNRGPRSYQPGYGNGNGDRQVETKGVQNASLGPPLQGDPYAVEQQARAKRRMERGMSDGGGVMGGAPPEDYSI